MSEALSKEAMLAGLRDIHLPATAPGGHLAELAAAVALAGGAALIVVVLLRLVSRKETPAREPDVAESLAALAPVSEDQRRVALLRLLKARAPDRFAALAPELYRPGLDIARLEAEVRAVA